MTTETRPWGSFEVLHDSLQTKVKRLILEPGKSISMQYHNQRSEFWFVENGVGKIYTMAGNHEVALRLLEKHQYYHVDRGQWHRLENVGDVDLEIIEIQYGESCIEEDIIRR